VSSNVDQIRDLLFAAISQIVATESSDTLIVSRLTREATALARSEAARLGIEFSNWDAAPKAVVKALLRSGSLLTPEGDPIPFDVTAMAAVVGGLREDYQDRTEAYLLEFLLDRIGDVTVRDHTALAHALFRQFDPNVSMHDLEDRVAILLARIADRVRLEGETYVVHTF
jgi:hypothetical protein